MLNLLKFVLRKGTQAINSAERNVFHYYHLNVATNCLNKDLTTEKNSNYNSIGIIKSAKNSLELLNSLPTINRHLNSQQIMITFKTLFTLQKNKELNSPSSEILKHPEFENLCKNLQNKSHFLDINNIIDALKILLYFGLKTNINIINALLHEIRKRINDLTLGHIVFLHFLLQKCDETPLVDALKLSLPTIFQIKSQQQIDHENIAQLTDLLQFASNANVSQQCIMNIISALTLHGSDIKIDYAENILKSLCNIKNFKISYEKLLFNCYYILNKDFNKLNYDKIDQLLSRIIEKYNLKNEVFYNEEFFNKCALYAIEMNVGIEKTGFILKKFNKINFSNVVLLDYFIDKILKDPEEFNNNDGICFTIISSLSTANYIPKNWDKMKSIILSHPVFQINRNNLPWMKICGELLSLNCYNENILNKIFSKEFLDKHLSRENNVLDYIQMLSLYQSVVLLYKEYSGNLPNDYHLQKAIEVNRNRNKFPLKTFIEHALGDEKFVCTKVTTKYGQIIDHVVIFDENNNPIAINEGEKSNTDELVFLEDLPFNKKVITIHSLPKSHYVLNYSRLRGIFEMKMRTIAALGVHPVAINLEKWKNMPDKEKVPYLQREINYNLEKTNTI